MELTTAQAHALEVCRSMAQAYGGPTITSELLKDGALVVRALHMDDASELLGVAWIKPNGLTPNGRVPADQLAERIEDYNDTH